jgi:hypothetical protein
MKQLLAEIESEYGSHLDFSYSARKTLSGNRDKSSGITKWNITLDLCLGNGVTTVARASVAAISLRGRFRAATALSKNMPQAYSYVEKTFPYWKRYDHSQLIIVELIEVSEDFRGRGIGPQFLTSIMDELADASTFALIRLEGKIADGSIKDKLKLSLKTVGFRKLRGSYYTLDWTKKYAGVHATENRMKKQRQKSLLVTQ